jgi:hypothetical protein
VRKIDRLDGLLCVTSVIPYLGKEVGFQALFLKDEAYPILLNLILKRSLAHESTTYEASSLVYLFGYL